MSNAQLKAAFTITRDEESALYKLLKTQCEDDAFRYEMIARKIMRVADGYGSEHDEEVVKDWLDHLNGIRKQREAELATLSFKERNEIEIFKELSFGVCANPLYQAYLDTLEQDELDDIKNNVGYFTWNQDMQSAYLAKTGSDRVLDYADYQTFAFAYANKNLSNRIRALAC